MPAHPFALGMLILLLPGAALQATAQTEEIRVEGTRVGDELPDPTAFGEVLLSDDFEAERKTLADLLSESPGVFVRRFGGPGDPSEVSIRGSSAAQVAVSINGVRADSALRGGIDLSRICLPLIERVEVQRGGGAVREGSGAIGGTVNLVTRAPDGRDSSRADFGAGSFETYQGSLFHSQRQAEVDYALGYCGFGTEGDFRFARPVFRGPDGVDSLFSPPQARRINNDRVQHAGTLGMQGEIGPGSLRFDDFLGYSAGGEPGIDCCGGEQAGQNARARNRNWVNLAQLRWRAGGFESPEDALEIGLHHRYEALRFRDPQPPFDDPLDLRQRISTLGARVATPLPAIASFATLHAGMDFAWDAMESREAGHHSRLASALVLDARVEGFEQRLLLVPALRVDWSQGFGLRALPALGIRVRAFAGLSLLANLTPAFRIPSFDELFHPDEGFVRGNPDLEAEQALEFDAGFEYRRTFLKRQLELSAVASYFYRDVEDSIVWVQINDRTVAPVNTGEARVRGVEIASSVRILNRLRISFQYTELRSRRKATGRSLPGVPERESFLRLEWGPPELWKLVGEAQYTGPILVSEGGGRQLPGRTVWNASVALNLAAIPGTFFHRELSRFWLSVDFQNLGDVAVRDALAFPQPGRSASVGFEAQW